MGTIELSYLDQNSESDSVITNDIETLNYKLNSKKINKFSKIGLTGLYDLKSSINTEYGLNFEKLKYAKKNALVMHPGPMNRGVEIESKVADDVTRSLIQNQVSMGVAIRMACLKILIDNKG